MKQITNGGANTIEGIVMKVNIAQRCDALDLLRSLPDRCTPLVFFDPEYRGVLDHLKFGNEGQRQRGRATLPAMSEQFIDASCREIARVLTPSGYLMRLADQYSVCEGHHLRVADAVRPVGMIAWDNQRLGMGKRIRHRGDYLLLLQKPPISARTWRDHGIPNRWVEKVDRKLHPHIKPIGLITRLIGAVTQSGDLVVDPAAGSFVVMRAALGLGRNFIGGDLIVPESAGQAGSITMSKNGFSVLLSRNSDRRIRTTDPVATRTALRQCWCSPGALHIIS